MRRKLEKAQYKEIVRMLGTIDHSGEQGGGAKEAESPVVISPSQRWRGSSPRKGPKEQVGRDDCARWS